MGPLNPEKLRRGSIVALDTVALVYFLEHHPVHHDTARGVLLRIEKGDLAGVLSSLVFAELLVPAYRAGDARRAEWRQACATNQPQAWHRRRRRWAGYASRGTPAKPFRGSGTSATTAGNHCRH